MPMSIDETSRHFKKSCELTELTLNQKIGQDVIRYNPDNPQAGFFNNKESEECKKEVLLAVTETERPLNLTETSKIIGRERGTTRNAVIDLTVSGKLECFRSGKALLCRLNPNLKCSLKKCNEKAVGFYELEGFKSGFFLCETHRKKAESKNLLSQSQKTS
jgi:hypothetical protein